MDYQEVTTKTATETQRLGQEIGSGLKTGRFFCLNGNLGAGKTVFTQGLAKGLGVKKRVLSPTFILMREYGLAKKGLTRFYHLDFYRLEAEADVDSLGLAEIFSDPGAVVVIEWADKIKSALPKNRTEIEFKINEDESREIKIQSVNA